MGEPRHRAAVFTGHFLPHIGGVEIYSHQLWKRLVARGWEVLLVTSDVGGGPPEDTLDGIRVRRLPTTAFMDDRFPIVLPSPALARTVRALDAFRPHVAVTNLRFMPPCWVGAMYARHRRVPRLHIEHGSNHVPVGNAIGNRASVMMDRTLGRVVVRSAERCVGVSAASAAFAASLGAVRPGILPMGVDARPADPSGRGRWRERLGIADDDAAVLYLGRVTRDKGALLLLDAWQKVPASAGAHLAIVGDGAALEEVRRRATGMSRVSALGPVPPSDVPSLLAACDILVHPSMASEGRPLSVVEAAAAGLAVIATPQGVAGDLIGSEAEGTLVPAGDTAALTGAMAQLISNPADRARRGAALQRKVLERFPWDRVVEQAEVELQATAARLP
jgi:glycosyltransferase involved in cell wall biosynthesis